MTTKEELQFGLRLIFPGHEEKEINPRDCLEDYIPSLGKDHPFYSSNIQYATRDIERLSPHLDFIIRRYFDSSFEEKARVLRALESYFDPQHLDEIIEGGSRRRFILPQENLTEMEKLGKIIHNKRLALGLDQRELRDKLNDLHPKVRDYSVPFISRLENGIVRRVLSGDVKKDFCQVLGLDYNLLEKELGPYKKE